MLFDLPKEQSSIIKVIGVGGGGSNAVNFMFEQGIRGVNFVVCNTDSQALEKSPVPNKIQLGPFLTEGLGAGADPEIGKRSAEESIEDIKLILEKNTKMVFITAGMGGGTGTGAAPVIARIARELGILTVGIVTTPFFFEGRNKIGKALEGIKELQNNVDSLIIISNDKIREIFGNLTSSQAFSKADNILTVAAKSISEIITVPGQINVDFADVQRVMKNSGSAIMGAAVEEGEDRAIKAAQTALNSPLLINNDISGAQRVLINITSGAQQVTMDEIYTIVNFVQEAAGNDADVIFGTCDDESMNDGVSVTVIATGFQNKELNLLGNTVFPKKAAAPVTPEVKEETRVAAPEKIVVPLEPDEVTATPIGNLKNETALPMVEEPVSETPELLSNFDVAESNTNENTFEFDFNNNAEENEVEETVPSVYPYLEEDTSDEFSTIVKEPTVEEATDEDKLEDVAKTTHDRMKTMGNLDNNLKQIEGTPAYKRRQVSLGSNEGSSQTFLSTLTYNRDTDDLSKGNPYLHGNVD